MSKGWWSLDVIMVFGMQQQVYINEKPHVHIARGKGNDSFWRKEVMAKVLKECWFYVTTRSPSKVLLELRQDYHFRIPTVKAVVYCSDRPGYPGFSLLFAWGKWKTMWLWISKAVGCYTKGLTGHLSRSLDISSTESN